MRACSKTKVSVTMHWQLEEICKETGLTFELLDSWDFNVLSINKEKLPELSTWLLWNHPGSRDYVEQHIDVQQLRAFAIAVGDGYRDNRFHNFMHAVDVLHGAFRYMKLMMVQRVLYMHEIFALLVAALGHDLGHVGLNNKFLIETQDELAIFYNDNAPLENLHCHLLFEILAKPKFNVFSKVSPEQYKEVRQTIIDVILHTDTHKHWRLIKELQLLYEMHTGLFDVETSQQQVTPQQAKELKKDDHKKLLMRMVLHAADFSDQTKPFAIAQEWGYRILEEFANQGEQEKLLGIPVPIQNDKANVNRPLSQLTYIEHFIVPMVAAEVKIFPSWYQSAVLLESNCSHWESLWSNTTPRPSEAERQEVSEKVSKASQLLQSALSLAQKEELERPTSKFASEATENTGCSL